MAATDQVINYYNSISENLFTIENCTFSYIVAANLGAIIIIGNNENMAINIINTLFANITYSSYVLCISGNFIVNMTNNRFYDISGIESAEIFNKNT